MAVILPKSVDSLDWSPVLIILGKIDSENSQPRVIFPPSSQILLTELLKIINAYDAILPDLLTKYLPPK